LITAKKLKVNPKDCLVIEDSEVGVSSAKKAGMKCIALLHKYNKNQDLSKADLIIKSSKKIDLTSLKNL
jgi:beta-phosphoglucomutase-like phosphatase (HAD superfamily)